MIITCPSCETRFNVDPSQLLPNGRTVKCARCGHMWTERPPSRKPAERALSVDDLPRTNAEPDEVPAAPYERIRARRPPRGAPPADDGRRSARGQLLGWLVLVVLLGGLAFGAVTAREAIIALWPAAAGLYEMAGFSVEKVGEGLEIRNVTSSQKIENDKPTLVVAGEIVNVTAQEVQIPKLRGSLLDVRQRVVFAWDIEPAQVRIKPGQVVPFDTTVSEPPASARRIAVAFYEEKTPGSP